MKYLGVNIHVPENEKLEAEMRKIKKAAKMLGAKIDIESTFSEGSYTVVNHSLNRAVVIGSLGEGDESEIITFTLNVFKYKWASAEGFSRDQVLGELAREIFSILDPKDVIKYLFEDAE
jgi:hypothetical protein